MKRLFPSALLAASLMAAPAFAATMGGNPMVGGAPMYASKNIIENAVNSADHTTLVAAVKAAGLVDTLEGPGPFTVFAPTNEAFAALPAGTVETLLKPENKATLVKILTAHVIAGKITAEQMIARAKASPTGFYNMQTVSGDALSAQVTPSGALWIYDESGQAYRVTISDVMQSNGVIHVVNGVLLPK
ncbi:fasciclin domain-containing protein [Limimaricola sp.]|uniref:fasciclin domain-containing protein n=1 Tax=Limimaricola sp. TaxID=2211665 RepID=UPI0025B8317A|nr:fasciclin domain-containing protein [Limimaricola sp.]